MHGLLPANPPAEFWTAVNYASMAGLFEKSRVEKKEAPVPADSFRGEAESTRVRAEKHCMEVESILVAKRISEGQAATDVEPEPAGVIYGKDATMDGAAFGEYTTEPHDDAHVSFIGSLSLLLDAEVGARVHYEGQLM